jgi:predicted ATPase/DNA-binding SARP family transcriptional activator
VSRLMLHLLGPPRLELDGEPIHVSRRKAVALLAYLVVTGGSHSRDSLATLLWPEYDQSRARANLRRTLSLLNRTLGEGWLTVDRETAGLDPDADLWRDVDQFRHLLAACEMHAHPATGVCADCVLPLEEALELYTGDFMAGFTLRDTPNFDEWQFFQTEGLRDELAGALERLVRCHSVEGEYEPAIAYARRWLALDPLHEPTHRHLMQLYAQAGQRAAALRQYQECARILEAELGLLPSEETTSLYEQIRTRPADREEPLFPVSLPRHNLPAQPTPFVGRRDELADIEARLSEPDCRLLTLVGPGGSGKTRLALQAAADLVSEAQSDRFEHGVYFVPLAPLQSVDAIVPTVAEAIGFRFYVGATGGAGAEPRQQLLDYVRQKSLLLIMDNFEHLLACPERGRDVGSRRGCVGLVTDILKTAPDLKILATSRATLKVQGECLFHVAGMDFPDGEAPGDASRYSAVELFLQSARRVQPDFELTAHNLPHVSRICRLVQGMPLSILLAAAWVQVLTPAEIAAEIDRSLDFLEVDLRDVPERQRSLRAVFDHSWDLLSEREREVVQQMSVFRGCFTRGAAEEITGASLRELMALVDKSLLHYTPTPSPGPSAADAPSALRARLRTGGRYEVHELLRQYAAEKLDTAPAVSEAARDRHSAYYAALLQQWEADLRGARQQAALAEIGMEGENARAAWDWATARGQVELLAQAVDGLCYFYKYRGRYEEGEVACRMAAERLAATTSDEGLRLLTKALAWQASFNTDLDERESASHLLRQSLAVLDRPELEGQDTRPEEAFVRQLMGNVVIYSDPGEAKRPFEQSLVLYQALGDRSGAARVQTYLGVVAWALGAFGEARRLFEGSLSIQRALGNPVGTVESLDWLGLIAIHRMEFEEAERLHRESLMISQKGDDRVSIAHGLGTLGLTLVRNGRFTEGDSLLEESVRIYSDLGLRSGWAFYNVSLAQARMHLGQYERARSLAQMSLSCSRELDTRHDIAYALSVLGCWALVEKAHVEAQALLQESVTIWQEIGNRTILVWPLTILGYAARGLGDIPQARQHLSEALRAIIEIGTRLPLLFALPLAALLLTDQGEKEQALEVYALASRYSFVANSRWFEDVAGKHIAAIAATLLPEVVAAAQERGRARDLEATVTELLAELGE